MSAKAKLVQFDKHREFISQMESHIRDGQFHRVELELRKLIIKKIPRNYALAYANLARRINLFNVSLQILNPIVRCQNKLHEPASALEQIEYAEVLRKLGGVNEALQILNKINVDEFPKTLFHQTLCCFSKWDYRNAISILQKYINHPSIDPYARFVGQVNLAAALIHEEFHAQADTLLNELRLEAKASGYRLLYGNILELSAQLEISRNQYTKAHDYLGQADLHLINASQVEKLWLQKWRSIALSLEQNRVEPNLLKIINTATEAGHWETVRDCTYYIAQINKDQNLMSKVYFGTPHLNYRQSLLKKNKSWFQVLPFLFSDSENKMAIARLDLDTGLINGNVKAFTFGQVQHRLLVALTRDLFKPLSILAAFGQLFPNECFDPHSSPDRVYQAVKRLRQALFRVESGLNLVENNGGYCLAPSKHMSIVLSCDPFPNDSKDLLLIRLTKEFGDIFSVQDVAKELGVSLSTSQRLLRWAVQENKLTKVGAGPQTKYKSLACA